MLPSDREGSSSSFCLEGFAKNRVLKLPKGAVFWRFLTKKMSLLEDAEVSKTNPTRLSQSRCSVRRKPRPHLSKRSSRRRVLGSKGSRLAPVL